MTTILGSGQLPIVAMQDLVAAERRWSEGGADLRMLAVTVGELV